MMSILTIAGSKQAVKPASADQKLLDKVLSLQPLIGGTPLYRIASLSRPDVDVYAKLEWNQLSGSVKARAAFQMLKAAVESGELRDGKTILEATSGNTGIALATMAARIGIPITLCLPANASDRRKQILRALGADLHLTDPLEGTDGAQDVAASLYAENPERFWYPDQYANPANPLAHEFGTAEEIAAEVQPTHFVAGLGTTGSFTGTARGLRRHFPNVKAIALQPDSPLHGLEGWKDLETARVPRIWDDASPDESREVSTEEALLMQRRLARQEGLLLSPSAAANAAGAYKLAQEIDQGVVVTLFADTIDKYGESLEALGAAHDASSEKTVNHPRPSAAKAPAHRDSASDTSLEIKQKVADAIASHASEGYPEEVCGFLLGNRTGAEAKVVQYLPARNVFPGDRRSRFAIDPLDWMNAEDQAQEAGLEVLGIFHTHPDHPAIPSATDRASALPGLSYLIVSVEAARPMKWRSWLLADDDRSAYSNQNYAAGFLEETLHIQS